MGLLDDAIREHLDLKRRRGADPAEVERAEREALGPVRRGPEGPETAEPSAEAAPAYDHQDESDWHEPFNEPADGHIPTGVVEPESIAPDSRDDPGLADPFAGEFGLGGAVEPEHLEPDFDSPPTDPGPLALEQQPRRRGFLGRRKQQPPPPEPEDHADNLDDDDPFADPPAEAAPPRSAQAPPPAGHEHPADQAGGETVEYEVEAAFKAEGEDDSEDPLEETPEFLQDTPDHDRLWFEQRPPRDFDFDG